MRLAVCIASDCAVMCALSSQADPSRAPLRTLLVYDAVFLKLRIIQFSIRAAKGEKLLMRALLDDVAML